MSHGDNIDLIAQIATYCLRIGYHVILEGIFFSEHYGAMLRTLIEGHAGPSHVFYLDTSLEETIRRHEMRPLREDVDPAKLREWYVPSDLLGIVGEVLIDGSVDAAAALRVIREEVGPVVPRVDTSRTARFL